MLILMRRSDGQIAEQDFKASLTKYLNVALQATRADDDLDSAERNHRITLLTAALGALSTQAVGLTQLLDYVRKLVPYGSQLSETVEYCIDSASKTIAADGYCPTPSCSWFHSV